MDVCLANGDAFNKYVKGGELISQDVWTPSRRIQGYLGGPASRFSPSTSYGHDSSPRRTTPAKSWVFNKKRRVCFQVHTFALLCPFRALTIAAPTPAPLPVAVVPLGPHRLPSLSVTRSFDSRSVPVPVRRRDPQGRRLPGGHSGLPPKAQKPVWHRTCPLNVCYMGGCPGPAVTLARFSLNNLAFLCSVSALSQPNVR